MRRRPWFWLLVGVALVGSAPKLVRAQAAEPTADARFEALLTAARETPDMADWKAVRQAFARTAFYKPYATDVTDKLKAIVATIRGGDTKTPEADLIQLIEQERFMRINAMIVLVNLYTKRGEPDKAAPYRAIIDGIIMQTMAFPDAGTSREKAIEVLFIPEEYFVASGKVARQAVESHEGHRYDVLTIAAKDDKPEQKLYFNIDRMWAANPMLKLKKEPAVAPGSNPDKTGKQ